MKFKEKLLVVAILSMAYLIRSITQSHVLAWSKEDGKATTNKEELEHDIRSQASTMEESSALNLARYEGSNNILDKCFRKFVNELKLSECNVDEISIRHLRKLTSYKEFEVCCRKAFSHYVGNEIPDTRKPDKNLPPKTFLTPPEYSQSQETIDNVAFPMREAGADDSLWPELNEEIKKGAQLGPSRAEKSHQPFETAGRSDDDDDDDDDVNPDLDLEALARRIAQQVDTIKESPGNDRALKTLENSIVQTINDHNLNISHHNNHRVLLQSSWSEPSLNALGMAKGQARALKEPISVEGSLKKIRRVFHWKAFPRLIKKNDERESHGRVNSGKKIFLLEVPLEGNADVRVPGRQFERDAETKALGRRFLSSFEIDDELSAPRKQYGKDAGVEDLRRGFARYAEDETFEKRIERNDEAEGLGRIFGMTDGAEGLVGISGRNDKEEAPERRSGINYEKEAQGRRFGRNDEAEGLMRRFIINDEIEGPGRRFGGAGRGAGNAKAPGKGFERSAEEEAKGGRLGRNNQVEAPRRRFEEADNAEALRRRFVEITDIAKGRIFGRNNEAKRPGKRFGRSDEAEGQGGRFVRNEAAKGPERRFTMNDEKEGLMGRFLRNDKIKAPGRSLRRIAGMEGPGRSFGKDKAGGQRRRFRRNDEALGPERRYGINVGIESSGRRFERSHIVEAQGRRLGRIAGIKGLGRKFGESNNAESLCRRLGRNAEIEAQWRTVGRNDETEDLRGKFGGAKVPAGGFERDDVAEAPVMRFGRDAGAGAQGSRDGSLLKRKSQGTDFD